MLQNEVLRIFYDQLNQEERRIKDEIADDALGLLLRTAINEFDLADEDLKKLDAAPDNVLEQYSLLRLGAVRIIKLAMETHEEFEAPTLTFQRNPDLASSTHYMMMQVGIIEHGRRIAQSLAAQGGTIELDGQRFRIKLPSVMVNHEANEDGLDRALRRISEASFMKGFHDLTKDEIEEEIASLLSDLVYPFREKFIGYGADPLLDHYFFGLGHYAVFSSKGYDTFHFATRFGGLTFQNYKLGAVFIVSIATRHREFAKALIKKHPGIRLEDVLTVSVVTADMVEGLRDFINEFGSISKGHVKVKLKDARQIFETLSLSRRNLELVDRPGCPMPPLVQCSNTHVIRPLVAAKADEVMLFLLNSLRHHFPRDYDRAQQASEGVMQRAISAQVAHLMPAAKFRTNVKLRENGKVATDLDLVVLSPEENCAVIIQLKHQDPYGFDMATKLSRTKRLNKQVIGWLDQARAWFDATSEDKVRATLRLPQGMRDPAFFYLIVGRHYAHSLREFASEKDFTFANMDQFATAVAGLVKSGSNSPMTDLIASVRNLSAARTHIYEPEPPSRWSTGNLSYEIVTVQSPSEQDNCKQG